MFTFEEIIRSTGGKPAGGVAAAGTVAGVSIDSRTIAPGEAFIAIRGDNFDGHEFIPAAVRKGAACVIFEKGRFAANRLPRGTAGIAVEDGVRALEAAARFHRDRFSIPVVAVTGSNGKTTTKDMCAWALGKKFRLVKTEGTQNNHIGVPLTLLRLGARHEACVLELGSNHPGEIAERAATAGPSVGIITNVGPSHLEHFGSLSGVFREKYSLARALRAPGVLIVNADDPHLSRSLVAKKQKPFIISIGIQRPADYRARGVSVKGLDTRFTLNGRSFRLATPGSHNVYNALAAAACCRVMGMGYGDIARRLASFEFPAGRLKAVRVNGALFIDDSYNSSPASLSQALAALKGLGNRGRRIMVMGDMLELGAREEEFHRAAGKEAAGACTGLVAVGKLARLACDAFIRAGGRAADVCACDTAEEAKQMVFGTLAPGKGDVVLVKGSRRMKLDRLFKKE